MNDEIKEILEQMKSIAITGKDKNDIKVDGYGLQQNELKILLDYITNLQQAIEVKNERIKEEQQEKERYIKFYNELNIWNKELQQENEDNLKCIKSLKEQLESVIKNNQELLEKWHKNNDKIVNLISENERLKQDYINLRNYIKMRNVSTEVEDKALLYNIELENINKKKYLDYKSRCEKAIEYVKRFTSSYDKCEFDGWANPQHLVDILQNGSDEK